MERHDDEVLERFGAAMAALPEVLEAYLTTGEYDYLIKAASGSRMPSLPFDHTPKQGAGPALARSKMDIADEFCATLPTFQRDLSAVESFKLGTMRHTDDRGIGQFIDYRLHHLVLTLFVQGCGCFVHDDDVRIVQQQASKGKPLLFTTRQRLVPRRLFFHLVLEVTKANFVESCPYLFESPALGRLRIADRSTQRT